MMIKKQTGSVLITTLVLTLVISIMVLAAVSRSGSQQQMAASMKDRELSFQAAESALKEAESYLAGTTTEVLGTFDDKVEDGHYLYENTRNFSLDSTWTKWKPVQGSTLHNVTGTPAYIIEQLPSIIQDGGDLEAAQVVENHYYQITARSSGGTDNASTILQSVYKKDSIHTEEAEEEAEEDEL